MEKKKHIVVLGGGYGGVLTAKKLINKTKKDKNVKITLIDKKPYHTMLTELHEVAAGRIPEDGIRIDFETIFSRRNIDVVLDTVHNIDFEKKVVNGNNTCTTYDYLVLGTGSKPAFYCCQGAKDNAFNLWSYEDALRIRHHMLEVFGKASVETDPFKRKRLLTFVVIGCGFTGIEMAGELAEWRAELCREFSIKEKEVRIIIADLLPEVLPAFDDKLKKKTVKRLQKMNVEIMLKSGIDNVGEHHIDITGAGKIDCDTVIWTAGVEGSEIVENLGDNVAKTKRHQIETDKYLHAKDMEDVYVVGDNIFYIPEGHDKPVPQMVENAEHSADTVAKNIYASLHNKKKSEYKPKFHGAMVSIGGRYGVAQINMGKTNMVFSGFIAMFIKHFINFIYFVQVAGFNKLWTYMQHEFFHVEERRSFVGGYFAKRSPNFFLVPLRIFLGGMWIYEGWEKLLRVMENPYDIFLIASKVATSSASVAEEAATWGEALPVPEFITSIVDWFMNLMFYFPSGEFTYMAVVFQTGMVIAEIVVGLCLLGGLFTMLASLVSIAMGLMIWSSGMAPFEMLWYIFGGIAMIGGSGSTFGMDYYVLPWLKKQWVKIPFVKKWYLYT
ncbi:FAD-dependent oxidoreductase [Spirochaeta isovalerica]|uniref:NADH:ubiquinone reductase (non-electrogenic) n=1 Tax=Spirochaeta isovalerica TaxID=150 RepID=A0A841R9G3_9SPIO|nr:FAD-dependent oxidoreductase [Spirochaeta isovalerica]MBB6480416.1 NADH dehydrogenase [Spirochaeta isovalerica]